MTTSTPLWTAAEAAAATGGTAIGDWTVSGVSIDSRAIETNDLFIAIRGPNMDGHAFVAGALAKGAGAAVVVARPEGIPENAPLLLVEDTLGAMEALGRAGRARSRARVAAVTGSVGKTGTKEALAHCLSRQGRSFATKGSLNNHWGVPLSLSRLPADAEWAVFELGMNHANEIRPLTTMVRPRVALITTVESVHLEHFPSVEAIADAKAEIFEGLEPGGIAVLPRDNAHFARLAAAAAARGARVLSFGASEGSDVRAISIKALPDRSEIVAEIAGRRVDYTLSLPGRHLAGNSLGALGTILALGADPFAAAAALGSLTPVGGRGNRRHIRIENGAALLIDESYNAGPAATRAAIEVLGTAPVGPNGRRIAVLGDMLELGEAAARLHAELAEPLISSGIDLLLCAGPNTRALWEALPADRRGAWAPTSAELAPALLKIARPGDAILVKGSHGSRMDKIVDALTALDRDALASEKTGG